MPFAAEASAQTSIVAIRTPSEMVIATDSKLNTITIKNGQATLDVSRMCKIFESGGFYFAAAGYPSSDVDILGVKYNLYVIARAALNSNKPVLDRVIDFERRIPLLLGRDLTLIRRDRPAFYDAIVSEGSAVEVIFFGVEKGVPIIYHVQCKPVVKPDGTVEIITERKGCADGCTDPIFTVFLGRRRAIDEILRRYPKIWDSLSLVDAARFLVTAEVVDSPAEVGLPIDIVRFDKSGARWIERKSECAEQK